jgi:hypothetical protein
VYLTVTTPELTPTNSPDEEPIMPIDVLVLSHVPPAGELVSVIVSPTHTGTTPPIAAGNGLTVTVMKVSQPLTEVYVIRAVPPATPKYVPVVRPMVVTAVLPLAHVPPAGKLGTESVPVKP